MIDYNYNETHSAIKNSPYRINKPGKFHNEHFTVQLLFNLKAIT